MVRGLWSICSHATEEEASSHHDATSPPVQPIFPTQAGLSIQPAPTAQPQADVISQLLQTLLTIQKALQ